MAGADKSLLTAPGFRLLVRSIVVMVVMMTAMVAVMNDHHYLCLRRVRCRETEDESQCEQNLFHISVSRNRKQFVELL
jgi:hypothetical protein